MTETTHSHILNRDTITQYLKEECHFRDDEIANIPGKMINHAIINKILDEFIEADIDISVTLPALEEDRPFTDPNFDKYIEKYPDKWKIIKRVMPVVNNLCHEVEYNGKNALEAIDIIAEQTTCTYEDMLFFFDNPILVREKYFEHKAYDLKSKSHKLEEKIRDQDEENHILKEEKENLERENHKLNERIDNLKDKRVKLRLKRAASEAFKFDTDNFKDIGLSSEKVKIYLKFLNSEELEPFSYLLPLSDKKKVKELKSATTDKDVLRLLDSGELADANICFNYQLYNYIYNDLDKYTSAIPFAIPDVGETIEKLSPMINKLIINNLKIYQLTALETAMYSLNGTSNYLYVLFEVLSYLDKFFTHFDDYSCDNLESPFSMFTYTPSTQIQISESDLPF